MKENIREKISNYNLKSTRGITLVALVVTIIVLLILAGVSLSAVFSDRGIFSRAEKATDKYGQSKARETLELVLSEFQMTKYEEGLSGEDYENKLDNKIGEVGELLPKEDPNSNNQQVIVDGYIFLIDRSVPKIIDELGKANDIIITARVSNNDSDGWVSEEDSTANITGTIKTYSGGTITETSAKVGSTTIPFSIDKDGKYTIENITDSGVYTIYAKDSKNKEKIKEINVTVRVDKTAPTVETIIATREGNKIKLSAIGHDKDANGEEQSGIDHFNYIITPAGATPSNGTFKKNETKEITVTNWVIYTIKVTATDKCGNTTEAVKETTVDMRDTTPPTLTNAKAEASGMKIKISVTATDNISGVAQINYTVEPNTVKLTSTGEAGSTGTISSGEVIELTASEEKEYTVTFTATDNAGNTSASVTAKATTIDGMTVAEVKEKVNASNIADYIGTKVIDYETGAIWRVFYVDPGSEVHPEGYFGDGVGTIYLKRDAGATQLSDIASTYYYFKPNERAVELMRQLNPLWRDSENGKKETSDFLPNERIASHFYDQYKYGHFKNAEYSSYVVATPPVEMWVKARNLFVNRYEQNAGPYDCIMINTMGYGFFADNPKTSFNDLVVTPGSDRSRVICDYLGTSDMFISSPSGYYNDCIIGISFTSVGGSSHETGVYCPVVPLDL